MTAIRGCRAAPGRSARGPRGRTALLLTTAALLAGCTLVGPNYVPPEVKLDESWLGRQGSVAPDGAQPGGAWWESFRDPVLTSLVQAASNQNLTLRTAGLRVIEARARRGVAVGRFFPQVQEATGGFDASHPSENGAFPPPDKGFQEASLGLSAVWELDFWGRFRRGIESADAELLASAADYDAIMVSLVADVASNYVLVRSIEERLAYTKANVALQADTVSLTETRFRAGAVSELDVSTARATLAATQALVPNLEDALRQTKLAICVLLGRTPSDLEAELAPPKGASPRVPEAPPTIAAGVPADLLRRRPDVRVAERLAAAQSARIGVAEADLYPAISISGSTGFGAADVDGNGRTRHLGDIAQSDSWQGFVGLGVRWPVLDYGRIENGVRVQDALFEQAVTAWRQTVLVAAAEVESGLSSFLKSRESARYLGDAVTATQRTADLALIQYRTGAADFLRVNRAQSDLVVQQDAHVAARAAVAQSAIRTFRALGGGWEVRTGEYVDADTVRRMTQRTDWGDVLDPDWANWNDFGRFPRPESDAAPAPETK